MEAATNHAYRALVDERIHQLLANRRWYRANLWAQWSDLRREDDAELRALLKIARAARKMGAAVPDPIDRYKAARIGEIAFEDDFNIEGQPEFNGSFR